MPKFSINTPIPQTLPKECAKAAKILRSFVDSRNQGLDGIIPRHVLEQAKGFAIFSVFKAGFLLSARAGSGIVIAKLDDGSWSAPSAMGTAGMGFGGQAGAEVTDFLIVLNSHSAVRSFMAAGSLTLGGNMSIAIGPLGRNGEATGAINNKGNVAAMYSYSKTKGLFGGVSVEGSVIVERQDANAIAYGSAVTVKMLLSGVVVPPPWAEELIKTIESCTGLPGGQTWIQDAPLGGPVDGYAFGGAGSPGSETVKRSRKSNSISSFPPTSWGKRKDTGSYFDSVTEETTQTTVRPVRNESAKPISELDPVRFPVQFDSNGSLFQKPAVVKQPKPQPNFLDDDLPPLDKLEIRPPPWVPPPQHTRSFSGPNPFAQTPSESYNAPSFSRGNSKTFTPTGYSVAAKPSQPEYPKLIRAIAEYDFKPVEAGDLGFSKGEIIVITEKSDKTDDWWTGFIDGRRGIFPANFVRLL
ncbi:hypothetical protein M422DRAFT_29799 [Sphaerobolus stellatus SS14]|uniref:SH3 domain-containing protein n=1 Tax=Sphaerobolus stellatus (strain SS14) TaxID=990650 RepID=A0A0C9US87_SPHS4|nr:hypothetical protein M422DRAFT_29799 [Sphaerobolus stellatus SS14]